MSNNKPYTEDEPTVYAPYSRSVAEKRGISYITVEEILEAHVPTTASPTDDLNKYGVPVWLIEALKAYDPIMTDEARRRDTLRTMEAKRRLASAIAAHTQPKEQQPTPCTDFINCIDKTHDHAWDSSIAVARPAASVSVDELKKQLMHTKVDVWTQGKQFHVNLGTVISYGDNWKNIMSVIQPYLAQPPDHSGCLTREDVEAAIGETLNYSWLCASPGNHEWEKMKRNDWCRELRQKLGLSGSQEKHHD